MRNEYFKNQCPFQPTLYRTPRSIENKVNQETFEQRNQDLLKKKRNFSRKNLASRANRSYDSSKRKVDFRRINELHMGIHASGKRRKQIPSPNSQRGFSFMRKKSQRILDEKLRVKFKLIFEHLDSFTKDKYLTSNPNTSITA